MRVRAARILLINPNSSVATTEMMVAIASAEAGEGFDVLGATATRSPAVLVEPDALRAAADEVVEIAVAQAARVDGVIVAAFGDPGLAAVRERVGIPAVGIAESAILAAGQGGRRFGIATTTPALVPPIAARVDALGLGAQYTGCRVTPGDPHALTADPARLQAALAEAVAHCIGDGAEAVIIGGGPLGRAAAALQGAFSVPIIAPIPAAVRRVAGLIVAGAAS